MITGLDHVVLATRDLQSGLDAYQSLLGQPPAWRTSENGLETAVFQAANTALELIAPSGDDEVAEKFDALLGNHSARLTSLVFRTDDINSAHKTCLNRGLSPDAISTGQSVDLLGRGERTWRRFRVPDTEAAGVKTFIIERDTPLTLEPGSEAGRIDTLDHVVIQTPDPQRALAHYGAKLGLRLALDRTATEWGVRLLFFRTGGVTLEVMNRLDTVSEAASSHDTVWGLSWRTDNLDAARARLNSSGLDVSDTRPGRKPGTRVFSVRSGTLGVPTLFLASD